MAFASVDDVRVDLGAEAIPPAAEPGVAKLIQRAEARIRQVVGDPAELIEAGRTEPDLVSQVISEMVAGVLRNRNAWTSGSETKGPFSYSRTLNLAVASGQLRLTEEHRGLLGAKIVHSGGPHSLPLSPW